MAINIAIDGPSASGKSTIAKELCKELEYKHLDTGAMYRCVALKVVRTGTDYNKDEAMKELLGDDAERVQVWQVTGCASVGAAIAAAMIDQ